MRLYLNVTFFIFIWILSVLTIAYFGFSSFPDSGSVSNSFMERFSNWDGGHFLGIAENGYKEKFQYAFFPLYSLVVRLLNNITGSYLVAAILISSVCSFLSLHLLYKLVSINFDKRIAEKVIFLSLIFPTSFYFLTAYSEGLFFFLVVACFYFLRSGKLFWATVFTALASATRLAGLALVLALLVEVQITRGWNRKNWYVIFSFSGFIFYCYFLYSKTGDPFYFLTAENHWLRSLSVPGVGFWQTLKNVAVPGFIEKNFISFLDLIFAIFGVGMIIRSFRFLPVFYSVYGLASIALPLFTASLSSIPRFLLPIFPIFILIALVKNKYVFFGYQLLSIMLLGLFTVLFINGYWVS